MEDLSRFEDILGYKFNNIQLLRQALSHSSYANERKHPNGSNERLEFLGDSVLSIVVSDFLYKNLNVAEGELTKMRASLVCEKSLQVFAKQIHLGDFLRLGKGEENTGGRERPSILADAFEAVIAAIYLDGGLEVARKIIVRFWPKPEDVHRPMQDAKSRLQEFLQQDGSTFPVYEIIGVSGPQHDPKFEASVSHNGSVLGHGFGRTKKEAEKAAALDALKALGDLPS